MEKALYQISKIGFTTPQKEFITIVDNTIDFSGDSFRVDTKKGEKEIDRIPFSAISLNVSRINFTNASLFSGLAFFATIEKNG